MGSMKKHIILSVVFFVLSLFLPSELVLAQDLAIGVLDRTLTAEDKKAIDATLNFLKSRLTDYKVDIHVFKPSELEEKLKENRIVYFIGTSGFYRRFQKLGLSGVATLFTESAPNPRFATGAVFVVKQDSPIKTIEELKGKIAIASWSSGFSSFFMPMGEIARKGFDPDHFFSDYRTFGPPLPRLLDRLNAGEGDVVLMRACVLEDLAATDQSVWSKFRILDEKKDGLLKCRHSTELYPNWTFVATDKADWETTREITKILLSIPESDGFGWAVVPDFNSIDQLYKTLKRGPYEYLRIQSLSDFLYRYRFVLIFTLFCVLMLFVHSWRTDQLVRKRTRSLLKAWDKERTLRRKISEGELRIEQLQKTEMIGAMSSLIAHEINGPLATIDNFCRGIKRKAEEKGEESERWLMRPLEVIEKQTQRISMIVAKVRSYAKREEPELEDISTAESIPLFISNFSMRYPRAEVQVGKMQNAWIKGHQLEFEVLIENLLKNAVQASELTDNATVTVNCFRKDNYFVIEVINRTIISSEKEMADKFTPLHSEKSRGLGIGILICRTIAEKMRGKLLFEYKSGFIHAVLRLPIAEKTEANNAD